METHPTTTHLTTLACTVAAKITVNSIVAMTLRD
jgi:hypothetical protein